VLQLFVVTTSEDPINRFTYPNPCCNHSNTWQYSFLEERQTWRVIMEPIEYCTTILLPIPSQNLPRVPLLERSIPDCGPPWVFSKRKLFLMQGTAWRATHLTILRMLFQLSGIRVLWSWHPHVRIWELLSAVRGLAIIVLPWMLDLWSSCHLGQFLFETVTSRWIFVSAVTCAAVVLWFFETIFLSVLWSLSVSADFRSLFFFT
jgi:hypothetical protein